MNLLLLLLILQLCLLHTVRCTNREAKPFWLSTEILHVEFKKNCLTTAFCHESRFTLTNSMLTTKEKSTVSWPAEELTEVCKFANSLCSAASEIASVVVY